MSGERSYPVLPCPDLEEALDFYQALGFEVTFKQLRPYACAVVRLADLHIHLAAIDGFDPTASYASAIITAPDLEGMRERFASGLRAQRGKVPVAGIPRMLPIRRKAGTATGFTIVDVGGNWLRFYRSPSEDGNGDEGADGDNAADREEREPQRTGLRRVIDVAARQGDSRGDEARAIAVLDAGLLRHGDAAAPELFEAVLYRAELKVRVGADAEAAADLERAAGLLHKHTLGEAAEAALGSVRDSLGDIHQP
jgi:catechol 2,3-dioxygenase-like lactoylglutathione lyase family enzyme